MKVEGLSELGLARRHEHLFAGCRFMSLMSGHAY